MRKFHNKKTEVAFPPSNNNFMQMFSFQENIDVSNIKIAKEARISLIECETYGSFEVAEIKEILKSSFKDNQIFHQNDTFSIETEISGKTVELHFEVSFPSIKSMASNSVPEETIPYFCVNSSTSIYQQPKKRRFFANSLTDPSKFIPKDMDALVQKMTKLYLSSLKCSETDPENLHSTSIISILAGTSGCGFDRVLNLLADNLCVDLIKLDCFEFWNIEGRSVDKLLEATIERGKPFLWNLNWFRS